MSDKNKITDLTADEAKTHDDDHSAPGTFVLVLILLATFAVYYFANWKALADVWHVR